ncbi:MAG: hypothetical protein LBL55_05880 [Propionibacteriaceae bacterium]|nr:hypothetical protein [Propionibacteriaceae bacterium]
MLIAAVLLLAGCSTAAADPPATPEASPTVVETTGPTPAPGDAPPPESAYFTEGTMTLVDCEPASDSFMEWARYGPEVGLTAMGGSGWSSVDEAEVGAVVITPTGEWAVVGMIVGNYGPAIEAVYLTPYPTQGFIGGMPPETVLAGYTDPNSPGVWVSQLETNSRWRGGLLALGEEAAAAALACVS